jgi:dihydropteroate synthase
VQVTKLSNKIDIKTYLETLGVDSGGVGILASKTRQHIVSIKNMPVGAANILKQDALSIGADLAVPRGTVTGAISKVDTLLIATQRQLQALAKKELAQPFGLKLLALELQKIIATQKPKKVKIMGVINANDDSFFSQSRFLADEAIVKIKKMIADGAEIIDVGGVSSRPNAKSVSAKEELLRVQPIYDLIAKEKLYEKAIFSCDSYEPEVIEYALKSGFSMVNDITGLQDQRVLELCAKYNASVVIMHMQGTPQTMQDHPYYADVVLDIYSFLEKQVQKARDAGLKDIFIDVGIGFGKTLEDNLKLIKHLEHFQTLGCEILVGISRKSMIDKISPSSVEQRLAGTLALHLEAVENGASVLRVHDVYEHNQALKIKEALRKV